MDLEPDDDGPEPQLDPERAYDGIPRVWVERETFAGDIERRNVPAPVAVWMVLYDPALGDVYCRGVVQWGDVIDRWSGSV